MWKDASEVLLRYLRDPIWQFIGVLVAIAALFAMVALGNPTLVQRWWQSLLTGAVALVALVALLRFRRVIARAFAWVRQQLKRIYLGMLWHFVVRPARDYLNVIVSPDASKAPAGEYAGLPDHRRAAQAGPVRLSGTTARLPEALGGVELVRIPAAEFSMGGWAQYAVYLETYYISKYPITNAQYKHFIDDEAYPSPAHWTGRHYPEGREEHPVVHVSWQDARAYCDWLSRATGQAFRLPTEAEWEKAAQGPDRRKYPWGDEWNHYNCNCAEAGYNQTLPVDYHIPIGDSRFGVSDMAGNVWEWTSTLYRPAPYDAGDGREDPEARGDRILRGGSFNNDEEQVRCDYRIQNQPKSRGDEIGFRIAVSVDQGRA